MLHLVRVNTGSRVTLSTDVPPSARVELLYKSLGEKERNDAVIMSAEGRLMGPEHTIASFSAGTEQKPIYVFSKRLLEQSAPPKLTWTTAQGNSLEKEVEELTRKPPACINFQKQALFAKQLADHYSAVCSHSKILAEEYSLQYGGLLAAVANCRDVINEYRKHHMLLAASVNSYSTSVTQFKALLDKFQETVELLQCIPFPQFACTPGPTPSTLHEWIKTQDEESSLEALEIECRKAIQQVEDGKIQLALSESDAILAQEASIVDVPEDLSDTVKTLTHKLEEICVIQCRLSESIQATTQKALRNGDATTIADLTSSHHMSLQMMLNQGKDIWLHTSQLRDIRQQLTNLVHEKLKQVALLQMRLSTNNGRLVFWHEYIKLAKQRFHVLEQVQRVPEVLGHVLAEVDRRRLYRSSFLDQAHKTSVLFQSARSTERKHRRDFREVYGTHFISSLFPSMSDRPPEFATAIPENFDEKLASLSVDDLVALKQHLPSQFCIPVGHVQLGSENGPTQKEVIPYVTSEQIQGQISQSFSAINTIGSLNLDISEQLKFNVAENLNMAANVEIEALKKQLQSMQDASLQLEQEKRQNEELNLKLKQYTLEIESLKQKMKHDGDLWAKESQKLLRELQELKDEKAALGFKSALLDHDRLNIEVNHFKAENEELARKMAQLLHEKEQWSKEIGYWTHKEIEINSLMEELQKKNDVLMNEQQRLKMHSGELDNQFRNITEEKLTLNCQLQHCEFEREKLLEELESLKSSNSTLCKTLEVCEIEKKQHTDEALRVIQENKVLSETIEVFQKEKVALLSDLEQKTFLAEQMEALTEELPVLGELLWQECSGEGEVEKLTSNLASTQEKAQVLWTALKHTIEQNQMQVSALRQQVKTNDEFIARLVYEKANMLVEVKELQARVAQLSDELSQFLATPQNNSKTESALKVELEFIQKEKLSLEEQLKSLEAEKKRLLDELNDVMDSKMKESMELEREVRELRRSTEKLSYPRQPLVGTTIATSNLQVGDQALFISDPYNNYLAMALDGSTYYLHHSCAGILGEDAILSKMSESLKNCLCNKGLKVLIGVITHKQLLEVKKESNRLRLPVGSRLYQIDAKSSEPAT